MKIFLSIFIIAVIFDVGHCTLGYPPRIPPTWGGTEPFPAQLPVPVPVPPPIIVPIMPPVAVSPGCQCPTERAVEHEKSATDAAKRIFVMDTWRKNLMESRGVQMQLRSTLMKMADSDSSEWSDTAYVATAWLANYFPRVNEMPKLCSFAQMINATVSWEESKNAKDISAAIDQIALELVESFIISGNNAINTAGCTSPIIQLRSTSCYNNGEEYDMDSIWKIEGRMMPCALQKATKNLYYSTTYADKLMAAVATVSLSKQFQEILLNLEHDSLYKVIDYTSQVGPISTCCCSAFVEKVKKSFFTFGRQVFNSAEDVKAKYNKRWEKHLFGK